MHEFQQEHFDLEALSVRLRAGHFVGERTAFVSHRVVNTPIVFERSLGLSRDAVIDGYIEHFRRAMAAQAPEIVLLSGGRDSRHIFLELVATGRKPRLAITVDLPLSQDAEIAARLCARAGVSHQVLTLNGRLSNWEREKNRLTALSAVEHAWLIPLRRHIADVVVYDGIGGDVLSAGLLQSRALFERFATNPDGYASEFLGSNAIDRVLPGVFSMDSAHAQVRAEMQRVGRAVNPLATFLFWNRTMRYIASAPLGARRVITPYLEPTLFEFLSRIPPEFTWDHDLHTETIARAYPEWADIPYSGKRSGRQHGVMRRFGLDALLGTSWRNSTLAASLLALVGSDSDRYKWAAQLAFYLEQLMRADPRDYAFDPRFVTGEHLRCRAVTNFLPA
jgi:hypothetical protein